MTDKQIKEVFKNGFYCIEPCPEIKELQAKLKRKEQECEELKETLKTKAKGWANVNDKILEEVEQIRVENEKLKIALKFRDSSIDAKNEEILKKCKNNRELIDKIWKLTKTLIEIKEITETCSFTDNIQLLLNRFDQILQKISEISDGRSPVSEQMTTTVPTARSWNSVSTKKFQDSEVENDR